MAENERILFETQVGKEVTWGTAVAPTAKLMGMEEFTIKPLDTTKIIAEQRGSLAPGFLAVLEKVDAEANFDGAMLYEDIHYFLEGVMGVVTPSGAGPYDYDGVAPLGTKPTLREQTFVHGTADYVKGLQGGLVQELVLSLAHGSEGRMSGRIMGQEVATDALESLSDRTVNPIMGDHVTLYIDDFGGTIGTTEVVATAFNLELTLRSGVAPKWHLGSLVSDSYKIAQYEGELKMVFEVNATSYAYLGNLLSQSAIWDKLVRISCTNGTESLELDFAGVALERPEIFPEEDGVASIEVTLSGLYESTFANWFKYQGNMSLATLP